MSGNYNKNDIVQVEVDNDSEEIEGLSDNFIDEASDLYREIIQLEVR